MVASAPRVHVFSDRASLIEATTEMIVERAIDAIDGRGRLTLVLAGGTTPRDLYRSLAQPNTRTRIDWTAVDLFWGDERCVPPDDPQSNYRMVHETLIEGVGLPASGVHRIRGELPPAEAASDYARQLEDFFHRRRSEGPPRFDLVLLGMGSDGHTASLFSASPVGGRGGAVEDDPWVITTRSPVGIADRISLTPVVLNAARHVVFLVTGEDKAARLREVLTPSPHGSSLPAQAIRPTDGDVQWMVDAAAAAELGVV